MQKIQILFPDPLMRRLRLVAQRDDQPISEIVRRATETWLERRAYLGEELIKREAALPTFAGGRVKVRAGGLREAAYSERTTK